MKIEQPKALFTTNVGSHMWKMNRPDSDVDLFVATIVPTKDILRGINRQNSHFSGDETTNIDKSSHEIGKVVNMLLKGNVNFVWGVMSPLVVKGNECLDELKSITEKNISKNVYNSIRGLAIHNYNKYIVSKTNDHAGLKFNPKELPEETYQKKLKTIFRTLAFGSKILREGIFRFEPITFEVEPEMIVNMSWALDQAYGTSWLPDRPDEKVFREFLLDLRLKEMSGELLLEAKE